MTEREKRKKKREETDRERNHEWVREIEREGNIVYLTQRGDGVTEKERMNISLYKKTKERERERETKVWMFP